MLTITLTEAMARARKASHTYDEEWHVLEVGKTDSGATLYAAAHSSELRDFPNALLIALFNGGYIEGQDN